jgi:hypothetical protein
VSLSCLLSSLVLTLAVDVIPDPSLCREWPLARLSEGDVYKTPVNVSSPGLLKASQPTIAQQTNTLIFHDDFYDRR